MATQNKIQTHQKKLKNKTNNKQNKKNKNGWGGAQQKKEKW